VKIPRGCGSAFQEAFDQDVTLEFGTPTIQVVKAYPKEGLHRLTPVLFVAFDQLISHEELLKTIRFYNDAKTLGFHSYARLATDAEIAQDKVVSLLVKEHPAEKYLAFVPAKPFSRNTVITVRIGPPVRE
jgi:hypothetical protein